MNAQSSLFPSPPPGCLAPADALAGIATVPDKAKWAYAPCNAPTSPAAHFEVSTGRAIGAATGAPYLAREYDGSLRQEHGGLVDTYRDLRGQYDGLRAEFDALRRPFTVSASVPYTSDQCSERSQPIARRLSLTADARKRPLPQ